MLSSVRMVHDIDRLEIRQLSATQLGPISAQVPAVRLMMKYHAACGVYLVLFKYN